MPSRSRVSVFAFLAVRLWMITPRYEPKAIQSQCADTRTEDQLTSALRRIRPHFLTTGSNASRLLLAWKTKHKFHIYSFR